MPEIRRGSFSLDLGFLRLAADVTEEDRQCAWEVYTEIVTRVAVMGKAQDPHASDFSGEVLAESLTSLYTFVGELRRIMRKFPVGRLAVGQNGHLGVLVNDAIVNVLRPFLEKWQAKYRHWWETMAKKSLPPINRQELYPWYNEFVQDWTHLRQLMRILVAVLVRHYKLVDVHAVPRLIGADALGAEGV
jgi:hypothetical protein